MAFVKGQSGNPSGRPKSRLPDGKTLTEHARSHTVEAFDALLRVIRDDEAPHASVISAANAIIERGWGRTSQAVEITGKDGEAIQIEQKVSEDASAFRSRLLSGIAASAAASGTGETVQ